ncbi:MAG: hypothetical protein COB04_04790 [Gammaproteobacteria bacterium]|nr:MAG: hypothetical protein COB04_04790 [Gammaproteobacteria bacterium]
MNKPDKKPAKGTKKVRQGQPLEALWAKFSMRHLVKQYPAFGYGFVAVLMCVGYVLASFGVTYVGDQFPVRSVQVGGQFVQVEKRHVEEVLDRYVSENFFKVDLTGVQQVLQELPWVYRASVRRVWPDKIYVSIDEEVPVAWWQTNKLINADGHIFAPEHVGKAQRLEKLPRLSGPKGSSNDVMAAYHQMGRILYRGDFEITQLALSDRRTWQVQLNNDATVSVDRNRSLEKLRRFVAFYNAELKQKNESIERIDLRYDNGIAISWKETPLLALNET